MDKPLSPFSMRFNAEDVKMMEYLRKRLGLERPSVFRLALRRLYEAEQAAAKKLSK